MVSSILIGYEFPPHNRLPVDKNSMRSKKRRELAKTELERTKRELENIVKHNNATMTESNSITKSAFSSSTPNIFSLSTTSTPRRNRSSFRNDTHHTGNYDNNISMLADIFKIQMS